MALVAVATMTLMCGNPTLAADTSAIQDAEVRACIDRAIPGHTLKQQLTVQVIDSTDAARQSSGVLYWKRGDDGLPKVFFRIEKSAQYQGVAVVMTQPPPAAVIFPLESPMDTMPRAQLCLPAAELFALIRARTQSVNMNGYF